MAYVAPTSFDLLQRYPAFGEVPQPVLDDALAEAAGAVGETWVSQANYRTGALLYAAHTLTLWGHGTSAEAEMARKGTLTLRSVSDGAVSVTRDPGRGDGNPLDLTTYGRQYRAVRGGSVFGMIVADGT